MYAVVSTGGKQYKVQQGETLRIEKIPGEVGSKVTFDRVLMVADGENVRVGQPIIEKRPSWPASSSRTEPRKSWCSSTSAASATAARRVTVSRSPPSGSTASKHKRVTTCRAFPGAGFQDNYRRLCKKLNVKAHEYRRARHTPVRRSECGMTCNAEGEFLTKPPKEQRYGT